METLIIYLNGMPGVGKLTVAKILSDNFPARLIDNHLILDIAGATVGRESTHYIHFTLELTRLIFSAIKSTNSNQSFVFTNALAKGLSEDEARFDMVRTLAKDIRKPFIPVLLHCNENENVRRLIQPERSVKGKLTKKEDLIKLIAEYQIIHPVDHPNALTIDTTNLSVEETADMIIEHIKCCHYFET